MEDRYQQREIRWAEELNSASLILQVNYDDEEARDSLKLVGYRLNSNRKSVVKDQLLASLLVGINCVTSAEYGQGELWPKIMAALNFANTQAHQTLVGELYREGLTKFKLARFDHPQTNIGEMLIHAGVPLVSLNKYINKLLRDYQEYPGISGADFNSQIRDLADYEVQAKSLDKPIWHFIRQAGDFADDFTDKCVEIVDDMRDGTYDEDGGLGLPDRVIGRVVELINEHRARGSVSRGSVGFRIEKPKFFWHEVATNNELRLQFPQVENKFQQRVSWLVEVSDEISSIQTFPSLSGTRAANSEFQIRFPSPQIRLSSNNQYGQPFANVPSPWTVPLYQDGSWLLVFDEAGHFMPGQGPLQPGIYNVLVPAFLGGVSTEITVSGEHASGDISPPSGWFSGDPEKSWVAKRLDLINATKISLVAGSEKSRRLVSGVRRPKFQLEGSVAPNIKGVGGGPILHRLPVVVIPASPHGDALWTLQVRGADRSVVHSATYGSAEWPLEIDLSADCRFEFDGSYEVILQGKALGSSLRQTFQITSGLSVRSSPQVRKFLPDMSGLEPCEIVVERSTKSIVASLDSGSSLVQISDREISQIDFVIQPDYEYVEIYNRSTGARERFLSTSNCHTEDLTDLQMNLHLVEDVIPRVISRWGGGHTQVLEIKSVGGNLYIELAELSDTAKLFGAFEIEIEGYGTSTLIALSCFEKELLQGMSYENETRKLSLEFIGDSVPRNLVAAFYSEFGPWLAPEVVEVIDSVIDVSEKIDNFGSFFVVFDISDKWAPKVFPAAPVLDDNAYQVTFSSRESQDPEAMLVKWFENGNDNEPPVEIPISLAWLLLTQEHIKSNTVSRNDVVKYARSQLAKRKQQSVSEYPSNAGAGGAYLKHMFITDLIDVANVPNEGRFEQLANKPFLSTLALSESCAREDLSQVFGHLAELWGLRLLGDEKDGAHQELHYSELEKLLWKKTNVLSFVLVPHNIVHPFARDPEQLEAYLEEYSLPPGRFFEIGTLVEVFGWMASNAHRLLEVFPIYELAEISEELEVLELEEDTPAAYLRLGEARPILDANVVQRTPGAIKAIVNLPAVSIRLALFARLAARGDMRAAELWARYSKFYQRVSQSIQGLVEHDLVLAELYLQLEGPSDERN